MFNFTGSARRPRNVNLSGRKTTTPSASTSQKNKIAPSSSLQTAREERAAREAERKRLKAAGTIQRTWRGRKVAEQQRQEWRAMWDGYPADASHAPTRISLFLACMDMGRKCKPKMWSREDLRRLDGMLLVAHVWLSDDGGDGCVPKRRWYLHRNLGRLLVEGIDSGVVKDETLERALQVLPSLTWKVPELVDDRYYTALSKKTASPGLSDSQLQAIVEAVVSPLQLAKGRGDAKVDAAYRAFNARYLITPDLVYLLGDRCIEKLIVGVDLRKATEFFSLTLETESKLWLLSHVVYFSRHKKEAIDLTASGLPTDREEYIKFLSMALSSVAVEVGQRIDVEDITMNDGDESDAEEDGISSKRPRGKKQPLPPFVKQQIESLVERSSVTSLLSNIKSTDGNVDILAGFALALLLVFPARRTEMIFWLCVALTADSVPAVKYVWNAVKKCQLYASITSDSIAAVDPLKYPPTLPKGMSVKSIEDQWNLIFLFLEMYWCVLSTGGDHEFVQGEGHRLALSEVEDLALFLKNLSFATYWWYDDLTKSTGDDVLSKPQENGRAWELSYFRTVVTNVLQIIYTRDSRRHFLAKDFWLMDKHLTLDGRIAAVVQKEEHRRQHLEGESEDEDGGDYRIDRGSRAAMDPSARRHADIARREKALEKKQRANYLADIRRCSEILQNLPFMIPFDKRVEIFREFVANDQITRRNGHIDPDLWRVSEMNGTGAGGDPLSKHKATIRRKHEFQDAYKAFWNLGEGLKEPIQIKFMDKFGAEEAGIDGGGVTKEFLTGVCGEAFSLSADIPDDNNDPEDSVDVDHHEGIPLTKLGVNMFKENPEHLLYPNPTILDEVKHKLRQRHHVGNTRSVILDILNRYEFCGRILGKCLYEGILVDLSFAPFFLLKWSQPSSASTAGVNDLRDLDAEMYRQLIGVNDLRDLDAEMYRHLMALMDFEGDVESTFNLDFTITTQIAPGEIVTVNLKPNGDSIPVTNANRLEYVHLVSKHRLVKEPAAQTAAFLKGLTKIINPHWLKMFNQSELQTLVGGDTGSPIDVEDLRRNTIYGGLYSIGDDGEEHKTVKLFWQVMHELDDSDRRKVLRFVTSVSRAPLLGFRVLRPCFSIRDAGEDQTRLCSASTCVNLLKLPRYEDVRTLRKKLLYSVRSNAGFDLS